MKGAKNIAIPLTLKQGEVGRTYGRNPLKVERQYWDGVVGDCLPLRCLAYGVKSEVLDSFPTVLK